MKTLGSLVRGVVSDGNCSGCGACALLDSSVRMGLDAAGYARPSVPDGLVGSEVARKRFVEVCPGRTVIAPKDPSAKRDPVFGNYHGVWRAWAKDPDVRHRGSSGGVLTALSAWLVSSETVPEVLTARRHKELPLVTEPFVARSPSACLSCAGSRYAPVPVASGRSEAAPGAAVVAKPCEVSALRAMGGAVGTGPLLSFFCGGLPSQTATADLVSKLGADPVRVTDLSYRGNGWPGQFTVSDESHTYRMDYHESWGRELGPTMQWRCKVCVDGIGEHADLVAADYWESDESGYPLFVEGPGVSVLIARTARGMSIAQAAAAEGVIDIEAVSIESLYGIQPHQRDRRLTMAARLFGVRLAGGRTPRYVGFGLWRLALVRPIAAFRAAVGGGRRYRKGRELERRAT